jgi:two-component system NtrC family sensor kinase
MFAGGVGLATIRMRWIVAVAVLAVTAIGLLAYRDELDRSEAGLADLGAEQLDAARAATFALSAGTTPDQARAALAELARPGAVVVLVAPPGAQLATLDGRPPTTELAATATDAVVRILPADAALLGLSERTAMAGVAHARGWTVAIAASAEHQRDRDRDGRVRTLLAIALAAAVVSAFAAIAWAKQRSESRLAHRLEIAELERSRDAELERLSRAATMAALGSGVAHELSTPLGVIVGRAEQLIARGGDDRTVKAAQAIVEQAEYIDRVVRGLLGLARGKPLVLETIATETIVRDTLALVGHRFVRKRVTLTSSVGDGAPAVRCEPLLLKHALINLLLNACDAAPEGSTVELAVTADATGVAFVVTDAGDGIAEADVARAIEPFFTTKPTGTGLGLAIASEIAKSHRGVLVLVPRRPRGTRATITLPREAA